MTTRKTPSAPCEMPQGDWEDGCRYRLFEDRVLVKLDAKKDQTDGGLFLPETAKERPSEGKVLAVGPGRQTPEGRYIPLPVSVGARVLISRYGGTQVGDDDTLRIMRADDVLAQIVRPGG